MLQMAGWPEEKTVSSLGASVSRPSRSSETPEAAFQKILIGIHLPGSSGGGMSAQQPPGTAENVTAWTGSESGAGPLGSCGPRIRVLHCRYSP